MEIDGTEVTFLTLNESPSTGSTRLGAMYTTEKEKLNKIHTFAIVFAWFSLYHLWKT